MPINMKNKAVTFMVFPYLIGNMDVSGIVNRIFHSIENKLIMIAD
jgi:hypothetical protein